MGGTNAGSGPNMLEQLTRMLRGGGQGGQQGESNGQSSGDSGDTGGAAGSGGRGGSGGSDGRQDGAQPGGEIRLSPDQLATLLEQLSSGGQAGALGGARDAGQMAAGQLPQMAQNAGGGSDARTGGQAGPPPADQLLGMPTGHTGQGGGGGAAAMAATGDGPSQGAQIPAGELLQMVARQMAQGGNGGGAATASGGDGQSQTGQIPAGELLQMVARQMAQGGDGGGATASGEADRFPAGQSQAQAGQIPLSQLLQMVARQMAQGGGGASGAAGGPGVPAGQGPELVGRGLSFGGQQQYVPPAMPSSDGGNRAALEMQLSQELAANLKKLKAILRETQDLAQRIEGVLGEDGGQDNRPSGSGAQRQPGNQGQSQKPRQADRGAR